MNDMPGWVQYAVPLGVALLGSGATIGELIRRWRSGYGKAEANKINADANKTNADAIKANAEAIKINAETIAIDANRSADFEHRLNERTFKTMDILEEQIKHLTDLVIGQNVKMDHMEREIIALRKALDIRVADLPHPCRLCKHNPLLHKLIATDFALTRPDLQEPFDG